MAAQELRWLTYLLTDLGEQPRSPPVLYVDNKAMLALCREHRLEHRTKHIALRYFLARELQQRGQLRLAYVASEANTADIFTKALAPGDHQRFCTLLDSGAALNAPAADFGAALNGPAADSGAALNAPASDSGAALNAPAADSGAALNAPAADSGAALNAPAADSSEPLDVLVGALPNESKEVCAAAASDLSAAVAAVSVAAAVGDGGSGATGAAGAADSAAADSNAGGAIEDADWLAAVLFHSLCQEEQLPKSTWLHLRDFPPVSHAR
ncbi:unnamed protein product [Closterium sp. NIES-54]